MSDPRSLELLHALVRRESSTQLQYIGDAFPWTTAADSASVETMRRIVLADRATIGAIAAYLARNRYPVSGGPSYPASFTTLNFLSLVHLIPLLIVSEQASIAALEKLLPQIAAADAKTLVENFLAQKKKHMTQLLALQTANPAPAAS